MFEVTEAAQQQVAAYFKENPVMPIRVMLHQGGCGGPQIVMAVDQKKEGDAVYEIDGVEYVMEKTFLEQAKPVKVDFLETGFAISSSMELGGGCSSCGSAGSCCS